MTFTVFVTPDAEADLLRLNDFLAEKSPKAALRAMDAIDNGLTSLTSLPERSTGYGDGRRALFIRFGDSGYVVQYRVDGPQVVIVRIRHMREDRD